jgi:hypothetical protein
VKEEMKRILQMVEQKIITVSEAERLLDALSPDEEEEIQLIEETQGEQFVDSSADTYSSAYNSAPSMQGKMLRVRITEKGEQKVQVNVPLSLVEVGLKIGMQVGPQFAPEMEGLKNIDFNELIEAIRQGASGKIVEVKDNDELVEIYVD